MAGFMNDPLASLGMGLLSGNYGSNSKEAFANAMRGGLLGMQQAGVTQSRQAQNQIAQQQLLMQQAAAKRKIEEDKAFEQWVSSLPPQEQAMARGNPELYRTMMTQKYQQQYAPPQRPTEAPSNIREWQAFQAMTPQQQQQYLAMKRANPFMDTGPQLVQRSQIDPTQTLATIEKGLKPGEEPAVRAQQAVAAATGAAEGGAMVSYQDAMARMPRLQALVGELSALGKKATYTKVGQLRDTIARETGMDVGEGAEARTEYISKVDNEILPLLRATFGAQFTEKEGQSLKATLGDPNKSPTEKDAVLRSFITTKIEDLKTMGRRVGVQTQMPTNAVVPSAGKVIDFNSLK